MAFEGFLAPMEPKSATLPAPMKIMKLTKLAAEFTVAEHDQERAEQDAEHQEEDRPQAVGHRRPAARVGDRRVQAEHRREVAQQQKINEEENQVLSREHPQAGTPSRSR